MLTEFVADYLHHLAVGGYAANTTRTRTRVAEGFVAVVGDKSLADVSGADVDAYLESRAAAGAAPSTLNLELAVLKALFDHAFDRRYLHSTPHPTTHRRRLRVQAKPKRRIPAAQFGRLLDAATHPRDRMILALGVYLLLRQSEIAELRVGDVDLTHGTVAVRVLKTGKYDDMPVSAELDAELRTWLTWYATHAGPLDDTWRLVPAKGRPRMGASVDTASPIDPLRPVGQPERIVQRAIADAGLGPGDRDGVHTLRRSAARAMFDRLVDDGYDGAGRIVQSLLHHSSFRQTEVYLGIEMDTLRRDEMLRGKSMFGSASAVAPLRLAV